MRSQVARDRLHETHVAPFRAEHMSAVSDLALVGAQSAALGVGAGEGRKGEARRGTVGAEKGGTKGHKVARFAFASPWIWLLRDQQGRDTDAHTLTA